MKPENVPPLRTITTTEFRQALIAVQSPIKALDAMSRAAMKQEAIRFLAMLAQLYNLNESVRVWEYVAKAVETAGMTVRDDDFVAFSSSIIETLQCPGWKAATNESWANFQEMADVMPPEWKGQFINYVSRSIGALLPLARRVHQEYMAGRKAERDAAKEADAAVEVGQ